jgi:hypothetical protein
MFPLGNVNQYQSKMVQVSCLVVYWTCMYVVMGSNSKEVGFILFHAGAISIFYIEQKIPKKICVFVKVYYSTLLYDPTVNGTSVDPTSQVCLSVTLVLPVVGN